jgi:cytochrome c-type biogenesis protein CcmH/NrfF
MDGVALLGVLWSIPLAVLVVGTPIVLTIAFALWLVRLALTAF